MTEFFVFAAILVAASLVFVLVPLWRAGTPTPDKRREANIAVYHQRYAEIEREVASGRITRRDAELEKDELGARLLADIDDTPALTENARTAGRPWLISLLMIALLVGGAGVAYWDLGDYRAMQARDMPDIATMLDELKQQVSATPDDLEARAMLARAQEVTGDYAGAANNYRAINAAMPEPRAPIVAAEAEATLQATDDLQGRAGDLFRQLLALDATSREALWYLGLGAAERGDNTQAVDYWDRLLKQKLPDDFAAMVRNRRNELAGDKPELNNG
ncbi:c-type cytochrome biogenesis protein CcmI [Salinisphaera aquimarina]|uniref:C-type cytochrome biogenesis protein CcmI n=1 Tax=Salinisphaera aquimarina TaxID=2094031 RepID=A0ABV7ERL2_9GAMM